LAATVYRPGILGMEMGGRKEDDNKDSPDAIQKRCPPPEELVPIHREAGGGF
jgi:hypothetical protein